MIKDGDLWEAFANSVKAKGVGTVGLTKVKGHATNEMVAEGSVQKDDKEGNDMADDAANKGAIDMQKDLADVAAAYAARHKE